MKGLMLTIFALTIVLGTSGAFAAPLYNSYDFYDGFATEDLTVWNKVVWAGTLSHDASNQWMAIASSSTRAAFMTKSNASVENTVEVGEKAAMKLQNLKVKYGWSSGAWVQYYVGSDADYWGDAWLTLDKGQNSTRTSWGWSFYSADTGWVELAADGAWQVDRYPEFERVDGNTLKATVYSDAALTNEITSYTWSSAGGLDASVYVGLRTNNTSTWEFDDMTITPEPGTVLLLGAGFAGSLLRRRKQ